jgi:predicted nucleic acid-binding protein
VKLVADANVLLSAVLGGRALAVLSHPDVQAAYTTEATFAEVQEYAAQLATKKRLPVDAVLLAVATLPITLVDEGKYESQIAAPKRRIGCRDPDDVHVLALALQLDLPVWSNDSDFADAGVAWYTTAQLLARLRV